MKIKDFKLEVYFGQYEFTAPYLLTQSDCESMSTKELLALEPGSEEEYLNQWLGYTETWGDPELRKIIASLYDTMEAEDILAFHGAQEAIFGYMNVMLDPGDHMIAMYPNYQSAYEVANSVPDCEYSKWYLKDDGEKWVVDFDELEALIRPNTKLIAVNTPNNPTGYTFTNDEIKTLCDICRKHDIYLFSDEVYKGLELEGEKRDWMADHYDKCVSLGVMSKSYGLAGLRIGWLAGKDHETLEKVIKFKHYMSICNSAPSEFLSKIALKHSDKLLERSKEIIKSNMALVDAFFEKYSDLFEKKKITCGPVAFHKLLLDMPVEDFCKLAVDKKGVLLLPASIYDFDGQYFRMGYGRKNVPESLAMFEEFLIEEGFAKEGGKMRFAIVDAFAEEIFGGNPAGVVILPEGKGFPSDEIMIKTAAELRYSETVFIKKLDGKRFHLRYFTPAAEVDLCGHATIAAFHFLREEGLVLPGNTYINETLAGALNIAVDEESVLMDMGDPQIIREIPEERRGELYEVMGLDEVSDTDMVPKMVSTGLPDILMPVQDEEELEKIDPDFKALTDLSKSYEVVGVHAFTISNKDGKIHARNFAPLYDIDEEAATGTANGALTYYLHGYSLIKDNEINTVIQGEKMKRPSVVETKLVSEGDKKKIMVGGSAATLAVGEISLD